MTKEEIQNLWNDKSPIIEMCSHNCCDATNYCKRYNEKANNKFKHNVDGGCNHFLYNKLVSKE